MRLLGLSLFLVLLIVLVLALLTFWTTRTEGTAEEVPLWSGQLLLALWRLAMLCGLLSLITGCSGPCHPTLDPALLHQRSHREPQPTALRSPDGATGISCTLRF